MSQASSAQYMFQYFLKVVSTQFETIDGVKVRLSISPSYIVLNRKPAFVGQGNLDSLVLLTFRVDGKLQYAVTRWVIPELTVPIHQLKEARENRNAAIKIFKFRVFAEFDKDCDIWL